MLRKLLVAVCLMGVLAAPTAFAGFKVSAVGAGMAAQYRGDLPSPATPKTYTDKEMVPTFGGGLLLEWTRGKFGLELGGIYTKADYKLKGKPLGIDYLEETSYKMIHVPVTAKFWFGHGFVGVGGYYDRHIGSGTVTQTLAGVTTTTISTFEQANVERNDYGVHGLIGGEIPLGPRWGIHLDARYNYSLKQQNKATITAADPEYHIDSIMAVAGLTFNLR